MQNKKTFSENLFGLALLFDKELTEAIVGLYWDILAPYSDDDIAEALQSAARQCKFFPKPAEIIELIEGTRESKSALAWAGLKTAIRSHGSYVSVQFDDPAIHSAVESMGGWIEVCRMPERELMFREKEFKQLYAAFSRREGHPPYLAGDFEATNIKNGFESHVKPPQLVNVFGSERRKRIEYTDQQKALKALTAGIKEMH